jgi:hypothetical protein
VLVYQKLFVAADANMSIAQQVELGDLLTSVTRSGFPIRVAVIAERDDLGAITALWEKPAAYAHFLGIELSLAYAQRLLVVMPGGFGFYWQGHQTAAADRVLGRLPIGQGGNGLATAAVTAVRALASASGVWLAPSAARAGSSAVGSGARSSGHSANPAASVAPSGVPVPLIAGILLAALAACAVGIWLARSAGLRLSGRQAMPLLGIDANPKATAIDDVLSYSQLHGMLYQWRYLTGSLPQLQSVWKAYSIGVDISKNQVDHEPAIFVIDQRGRLAKLYLTQLAYSAVGQLGQLLADEVATLLPSHPVVRSHLSYAQASPILPATMSTLPEEGGGYADLGPGEPGKPRLYLFFATWDQEITTLGGQLDALNAYQSAAGAAGLPALTAIDEGSVEPSASALPGFLASLRQPLGYPVAIDSSGRVADGYAVAGEPWLVLVSPDGQAIWSWEVSSSGWLSRASLDQHVRAALASAANPPASRR